MLHGGRKQRPTYASLCRNLNAASTRGRESSELFVRLNSSRSPCLSRRRPRVKLGYGPTTWHGHEY